MTDIVDYDKRSEMMSGIKSKNTNPEIIVRRVLFSTGRRFRLHRQDLPGAPDIVLPKYRVVIFVHGCFWHMHAGCRLAKMPGSNINFWRKKLEGNRARDSRNIQQLLELGWRVLIVWECSTKNVALLGKLVEEINKWFISGEKTAEIPTSSF